MCERKLTPWQQVAAAGVESLYALTVLLLRLTESVPLLWLLADGYPADPALTPPRQTALLLIAGTWLLQGLVLPPLRLGRTVWYCRLAEIPGQVPPLQGLFAGWRRVGGAISWRWRLWWKRITALLMVFLPTGLLWNYGGSTPAREAGWSWLWLAAGGLWLLTGVTGVLLWQSRYALTPVLLAEGWPAGAAMQLSARVMGRYRGTYLNFWGGQLSRLAGCALLLPIPWLLPRLRRDHAALLLYRRRQASLPQPDTSLHRGACILRPSLL